MPQETGPALLRKTVDVLNLLAAEGEATPSQIAEQLSEPRPSVYRLLASMRTLDLLEAGTRKGTFRLGFHLLRLGSAVVSRFDERQLALPVMERLHEETGETVFLCVRRGTEAVCIERLEGRRVQSLALKIGGALPLHAGAASRVLLAFEEREEWQRYLAQGELREYTPSTPTSADALVPLLEETRRTGIAVSDQDVTVGIAALGVPITDYRGGIRAALSISGVRPAILGPEQSKKSEQPDQHGEPEQSEQPDQKTLRARLIEAGHEISRAMGGELAAEPLADLG